MKTDEIRLRLRAQGPLIIRTSDGRQYPVPHPDFAWVGRFHVVVEDLKGLVDIIDSAHIVSIWKPLAAKGRRGRPRKAA